MKNSINNMWFLVLHLTFEISHPVHCLHRSKATFRGFHIFIGVLFPNPRHEDANEPLYFGTKAHYFTPTPEKQSEMRRS
jgi:hypothetical protein